jgi:hypothetical protein
MTTPGQAANSRPRPAQNFGHITRDPHRQIWYRLAPDPQSLIVVGNRGLGAIEGHELGSVPSEVVHQAQCDVLIVQIPEDAESEFT